MILNTDKRSEMMTMLCFHSLERMKELHLTFYTKELTIRANIITVISSLKAQHQKASK